MRTDPVTRWARFAFEAVVLAGVLGVLWLVNNVKAGDKAVHTPLAKR